MVNKGDSIMKQLVLLLCIILSTSACSNVAMYQRTSSGKIGCPPEAINIQDVKVAFLSGQQTWRADCDGVTYYCSSTLTGHSGDISCTEGKH